jgi:hypothetical protein
MGFTVTLSDKNASGEASQDNCVAYLSFCESNDTLPRTPFTVWKSAIPRKLSNIHTVKQKGRKLIFQRCVTAILGDLVHFELIQMDPTS